MYLANYHGYSFKCKIKGEPTEGKITVEGDRIYLCQDDFDGADSYNKFNYIYSWEVTSGLKENSVTEFQLTSLTVEEIEAYKDWQEGDKITNGRDTFEVIFRSGEVVILKNEGGCAEGPFTCFELYDLGYRLSIIPTSEEKTIEVTMDEIAKKFNIPVKNLKIKKE